MKQKINTTLISLYDIENNAIRSVAAMLRKHGFRVFEVYFKNWVNNRLDWPKKKELDNLISILRDTNTNLVGISLRASAYLKVAILITEKIKETLGIPVVWGGIHPTLVPEECIEIADIVCIGEGEYPMLELIRSMSYERPIDSILNLWIRTEKEIKKNDIRQLIENLDDVPFLDYTSQDKCYLENGRFFTGDPLIKKPLFRIMASRGCLYNCSYCYNSALKGIYRGKGKYFRYRSVKNVIEELTQAKKIFKNLKYVRFDDEMFIFSHEWIKEFCQEYKKKVNLPFECFLIPGNYEEELFYQLKQAGLKVVYMGIEGPERINKTLYNRGFSEKDILRNVEIFHRLKIDARYQGILDDPVSEENDKRRFFEFLMSFPRPFELYLFSLTIFPKTILAKKLLAEKLITEDNIEGKSTKTFSQLRVDLSFPRAKSDQFWTSLIVLITKNFIPKKFIYKLSRSKFLYKYPKPLLIFSQICNSIKMIWVVFKMIFKGEMTPDLFKQWLNLKSLITQ
jgi:radical SAM superfamily enzyme YgiQ (UPF0313 family)